MYHFTLIKTLRRIGNARRDLGMAVSVANWKGKSETRVAQRNVQGQLAATYEMQAQTSWSGWSDGLVESLAGLGDDQAAESA